MMENNVYGEGNYHSCVNAYVAGYRIGGKSGTAERTDRHLRGDGDYYKTMSFAAVLPIDDPEIEVFVLLDDPRWVKDYASRVVAPVVGNIISEVAPLIRALSRTRLQPHRHREGADLPGLHLDERAGHAEPPGPQAQAHRPQQRQYRLPVPRWAAAWCPQAPPSICTRPPTRTR